MTNAKDAKRTQSDPSGVLRPDPGLTIHVILALKREGYVVNATVVSRAIAHTLDYLNAMSAERGDE